MPPALELPARLDLPVPTARGAAADRHVLRPARRLLAMRHPDAALEPAVSQHHPVAEATPVREAELDALMAALADGDRSVFARVFDLLWPRVHRLCAKLLNNEADAADAAQEAMQKILERASDYDRHRPAMPWAMAIAGWECRTLARRRARRREVAEDAAGERAGASLEEELALEDLIGAAVASLGELSESDREALVATFWDEAASVSGATLRKRRERALRRLRAAFGRIYGLD